MSDFVGYSQEISLPAKIVIAHRGTTYWAPEETEAAMRWARNTGADYLEFDIQRTKDGRLIAFHDLLLTRTTNVKQVYPEKENQPVSDFLYEELLKLDAGTWFNQEYASRARESFQELDVLTLEDIIQIAEGKKIVRNAKGKRETYLVNGKILTRYENDPADNGNRPGLYIETKNPGLFPGIEKDLKTALSAAGWYNTDPELLRKIPVIKGKTGLANTTRRVILQTFSLESLKLLKENFNENVSLCYLLWRGEESENIPSDDLETFRIQIIEGRAFGATIAGPSISGGPNNYFDLLTPSHYKILEEEGFKIHAYSFDTDHQYYKYQRFTNGFFTNRAELTFQLLGKTLTLKGNNILNNLGY